MKTIRYRAIGKIHTPFKEQSGMPIQPVGARQACGTVRVFRAYAAGLKDLAGFSHVILLYHFHKSQGFALQVIPFMDTHQHGVFATRAPKRPNPVGLSVVRLLSVKGHTLMVRGIDVLDGTPLLDIKPYVPEFDDRRSVRIGWLRKAKGFARWQKSDRRFI